MKISPLNYPGNKAKVIKEIKKIFPSKIDIFVDSFCGSGIVAYNSGAKKIVCNDINKQIIDLLKYMKKSGHKKIIKSMNKIIQLYGFTDSTNPNNFYIENKHEGLSNFNKIPFNNLKREYNKTKKISLLFALIIFGFNHLIRFNSKGEFNVPVGKVDYSKSLRQKTIEFCNQMKKYNVTFVNTTYLNPILYSQCTKNSLVYFDPPYLITNAPYNLNWTVKDDQNLFNLFDKLSKKGIKVAMSNVFKSNGKINQPLIDWSSKYKIHYLSRQYRNANYQKKNVADSIEVLITNY